MTEIRKQNGQAYLSKQGEGPFILSGGLGSLIKSKLKLAKGQDTVDINSRFTAVLDAPQAVLEAHRDYTRAGVDSITIDTFRGFQRKWDLSDVTRVLKGTYTIGELVSSLWTPKIKAKKILAAAFNIASEAIQSNPAKRAAIAISLGPLDECYDATRTPPRDVLEKEHRENITLIKKQLEKVADGQAAYLIAETLPSYEEGEVIAQLADQQNIPFLLSFTVGDDGNILDGTPIEEVVAKIVATHPNCIGIGVNCCSLKGAELAVKKLAQAYEQQGISGKQIFVEPNGFKPPQHAEAHHHCDNPTVIEPETFVQHAWNYVAAGATGVGGCCGTTPDHIEAFVTSQTTIARPRRVSAFGA